MLGNDLYGKVLKPEIVLAHHLVTVKTVVVQLMLGVFSASADAFKVTVFGHDAHGDGPRDEIHAVVLVASIIVRLQSIVASNIETEDVAFVTCASTREGEPHNVIPREVEFTISIRAFDDSVRRRASRLSDEKSRTRPLPRRSKKSRMSSWC